MTNDELLARVREDIDKRQGEQLRLLRAGR